MWSSSIRNFTRYGYVIQFFAMKKNISNLPMRPLHTSSYTFQQPVPPLKNEDSKEQKKDERRREWRENAKIASEVCKVGVGFLGLFWGSRLLKEKEENERLYRKARKENEKLEQVLNSKELRIKFMEALLSNDVSTVDILMRNGIDISKTLPNGSTLFHFAATCSATDVLHYLCNQIEDLGITDRNGFTALHRAVFKGNLEAVKIIANKMVEKGININKPDSTGYTALHMAAYMGFPDIVRVLLAAKAIPDVKDNHDQTPYDYAYQCGYSEIAKILRPLTITNKYRSKTYEHDFIREYEKQNDVATCVTLGVDPFYKNNDGDTAIHIAIIKGNKKLFNDLISYAEKNNRLQEIINIKNKTGESPILLACTLARENMIEILLEKGANPNSSIIDDEEKDEIKRESAPTALHVAASLPEGEEIAAKITCMLLRKIDHTKFKKDKAHWSPVHRAAALGYVEVLKHLLNHSYSVNIYSDSWTPLHEAVCSGKVRAVKFLLEEYKDKINISPQEECGETPLHMAIKKYRTDPETFSEIIDLLIKSGANLAMTDNDGKTAADYAYYLGNWDIYNRIVHEEHEPKIAFSASTQPFYQRERTFRM